MKNKRFNYIGTCRSPDGILINLFHHRRPANYSGRKIIITLSFHYVIYRKESEKKE